MIEIEPQPWRQMVEHARATYPNECCGAMLGTTEDSHKRVIVSMPLRMRRRASSARGMNSGPKTC